MRPRKKKNLNQRLEASGSVLLKNPEQYKGKFLSLFENKTELHLEIGCGKGGFICEMAEQNPEKAFIAIEKEPEVLVMAMENCIRKELSNLRFLSVDAKDLCEIFETAEIDRIYLNFSDPWPKARHAKRRLTYGTFLKIYENILKKEGEIWQKTDNTGLFEFSLEQFKASDWHLFEVIYDLHSTNTPNIMTEYEIRFSDIGTPINRLIAKFNGGNSL